MAFYKMTGYPLLSANRLKAKSPNITWMELRGKFSMQYSTFPVDSHTTQAFTQMEQGPDELLDMYLHHTSELLSKIYHTLDISEISAGELNHNTMVYGLNYRRLKDSIVGYWSAQWKAMEDLL